MFLTKQGWMDGCKEERKKEKRGGDGAGISKKSRVNRRLLSSGSSYVASRGDPNDPWVRIDLSFMLARLHLEGRL